MLNRPLKKHLRDSLLYLFLLTGFLAFSVGIYKGGVHLVQLKPDEITIRELPSALFMSFLRMLASYVACIFFAFLLGLIAARSKVGERMIIPLLDIFQSVPVIGFFPAAMWFFIGITNGHRIGVEMAASFLIFTSQAWNIAFAVYEAIKTIPNDNLDAVISFGVKGSLRFWKLFAPAAMPRVIQNSILSWSNGWYFLVSCEIIALGNVQYHLPGIGSFLARAAENSQIHLVFWGLLALTLLILGLDFLIWRPATIWAERFKQDYTSSQPERITRLRSTYWSKLPVEVRKNLRHIVIAVRRLIKVFIYPLFFLTRSILLPLIWDLPLAIAQSLYRATYLKFSHPLQMGLRKILNRSQALKWVLLWVIGAALGGISGYHLIRWLRPPWPSIAREIPMAIVMSTMRLVLTLGISIVLTLPVIVFSWNRPKLRQALTTLSQVGASLPAVALFPLIILFAVRRLGGGMESASIMLLFTGMVWYVLFNGLGATGVIPNDLAEATRGFGLNHTRTWKHLVLPAIRPALITGCITAWGGGWNALVVSEYVQTHGEIHRVRGIGELLSRAVYELGDHRSIGVVLASLVVWVVLINSVIWQPLYRRAAERYRFEV